MPPWMSERATAALLLLLSTAPAWADGSICPDRPGKGTSACTVDEGRWQAELGVWDGAFQHRSGIATETSSAGSLLLKYGVSGSVDLEAGMTLYQSIRTHGLGTTQGVSDNGDLTLHAKWNPGGSSMTVVLDPFVKLPTANRLGNGAVEGGLVVPLSWDLGNSWSLAATPETDISRNASGSGYHLNAVNVVGLGYGFPNNVSLGAEIWTAQNFDPAGSVSQYSFDLDAAWLTDPETQLDAGINVGLNRATPDLEFYAGMSRRF